MTQPVPLLVLFAMERAHNSKPSSKSAQAAEKSGGLQRNNTMQI